MTQLRFADIGVPTPTADSLAVEYAAITVLIDRGRHDEAREAFDQARRAYESWSSLVGLRFEQDTADADRRTARDYADALAPVATEHEVKVKRRLLALPDAVADQAAYLHRLWRNDLTTFDPAIAGALREEAALATRYTSLMASARLEVDGQSLNLSGLAPFTQHPDRDLRHRAEQAHWAFFAENGDTLDGLYDELVRLRHGMARTLGFDSYVPLAYRRLRRTDYGPDEVARYRDEVATHVTPLVARLLEQRRRENGWDTLYYWDESLIDPAGNPGPVGDHDTLVAAAQGLFDAMDPRLGDFYRFMVEGEFLDLKNRPTKAGGGFCTSFPTHGAPFIFANFNGTADDVNVFTHEMGHAFQNWQSRDQPGIDLLWPTSEAAEINSMGLEFLSYPEIGRLVGQAQADRFRRMHLISSLAFLPYGVCVDHFQHEVFAHPAMRPAERHATWQSLERRYMPWRNYGDLAYPAMGGLWQAKQHIYGSPFYYIDYTLALCCAMQFWTRSRSDYKGALDAYVALASRGGSAPFGDLVASAGLTSPFQPGVLAGMAREAASVLGV